MENLFECRIEKINWSVKMDDKEIKMDDEYVQKFYEEICEDYEKNSPTKTFAKINLVEDKLKITDSKIVGLPYLPKGAEFPKAPNGEEMLMIAQINCEDLKGLKDFPQKGILQFFVFDDDDAMFGLDFDNPTVQDTFRVIYYDEIKEFYDEKELENIYKPHNYEESFLTNNNESYKIKFELRTEKERFEEAIYNVFDKLCKEKNLEQHQEDWLYRKILNIEMEYSEEPHSQCDGFAFFTQSDPREFEEKYKKYDTVLFQLDSEYDENTKKWKVCIGDAGVLNFFINREKLKNKDFTEILYNWDCY